MPSNHPSECGLRCRVASRLLIVPVYLALLVFVACSGEAPTGDAVGSSEQAAAPLPQSPSYDPALARALALRSMSAEDLEKAEVATLQATRLAPSMVDAWLLLAGVRSQRGDVDGAFAALDGMAGLGVRPPVDGFEPLAPLHEDPRWPEFLARLDAHLQPSGASDVLFTLPEKDLLTEGVVYDRQADAWYVSAVHGRKIVRLDSDGSMSDRLAGRDDVWGVFGMALDAPRRKLWAVTTLMPQVRGFDAEVGVRTALLAVDLDSAEIVGRYELEPLAATEGETEGEAQAPAPRQLNDLAVAADGTVYATDLRPPGGVYRLAAGGEVLERIGEDMLLNSPQGVVLLDDDSLLLVADYSLGLVALDLQTGESWFVEPPADLWTQAFDGLASAGEGRLVAVQNGRYPPHRILQLRLGPERRKIVDWSVAAQALPEWSEPTLGTVVRDGTAQRFVYVAASQWPLFPENGEPDAEQLAQPVIMSVDLVP